MIIKYKIFENISNYPQEFVEAVNNTPGAEITPKGIKLEVSRFQKPEQAGDWSVRSGVFFLPEIKSPYNQYYKNKTDYGGPQYITGKIFLEKPFVIKAGTGGVGPKKAYIEIVGKSKYQEMNSDAYKCVQSGREYLEENIYNFLEKHGGNPDSSYDIMIHSRVGNRLLMALLENVYAGVIRNAGYDSILSYSKSKGLPRLSELFDLRWDTYPEETNFEYGF